AGEKIIHVRQAGRSRMSPGDTLHRRQSVMSQRVREWIHADVAVVQNVGTLLSNCLEGEGYLRWYQHEPVGRFANPTTRRIIAVPRREDGDGELPSVQPGDYAGLQPAYAVISEVA